MTAIVARSRWSTFESLGTADLYAVLHLRNAVFVVEQRCAYLDVDGLDPAALHLLAWTDGHETLAGTLRLFGPDADEHARIGRVATAPEVRGLGLGRWLMREAIAECGRRFGTVPIAIGAQVEVERFYAGLGFVRSSPDYDEDGITHCRMILARDRAAAAELKGGRPPPS